MTKQEDLECEIQEYQIELERHEQAIDRLKIWIEKKKKELEKMKPPNLYNMLDEFDDTDKTYACNVVAEWLSKHQCDYVTSEEHLKGYNFLMETLKENVGLSRELDPKNLPYFVGN